MQFFELTGFMIELLITSAVFTYLLPQRSNRVLRYSVSAVISLSIAWMWSVFFTPPFVWAVILRSIVFYALCYAALWYCVELTWKQTLFLGAGTIALQHACYSCSQIVLIAVPFINQNHTLSMNQKQWFVYPLLFAVFLALGFVLFVRPMKGRVPEHIANSFVLVVVGIMLCVTVFSSLFDDFISQTRIADNAYFMFVLTRLVTCIFLLVLLKEITERETAQRDNEFLSQLLHQQRQKYESDKETIDLINVKTHDLKKQLTVLEDRMSQQEIDDLKKLVGIYDSSLHTGNETLDVLLAHKALICEQRSIQFDRMIDGAHVNFMKPADIYSLFGNAVDNAMEAVMHIEDVRQRYIRMKVNESRGMLVIHVENSCAIMPRFINGVPQTIKTDKRYHGFGIKSMRMITERYNGVMTMNAQDHVFTLNIMIPLTRTES
ncbi:ATP-binding protein [Alloscardovia omnicolens]|uniref:ATP-binding protein n=1 Tax=Alloscardovia omnicolens TaxID=419015 RepID=UPI003A624593